jgi:hypothetical protein
MGLTLPAPYSLQVMVNHEVVFQSTGKWLFPLFDLEDYLRHHSVNMSLAIVHDKVIGKAAALLLLRLGAGHIHGDLMSDLAILAIERSGIPYSFVSRVPKLDCQTEKILRDIDDFDIAYRILCERAKRC